MALLRSLCIYCGTCCAAAFALLPEQLFPPIRVGTAQFSHCSLFLLICEHQDNDAKQGERSHTHTYSSFVVHELITHFSTGINSQILLFSLRRALDRIAVFIKAKKQMENLGLPGLVGMCCVRAFTHCSQIGYKGRKFHPTSLFICTRPQPHYLNPLVSTTAPPFTFPKLCPSSCPSHPKLFFRLSLFPLFLIPTVCALT